MKSMLRRFLLLLISGYLIFGTLQSGAANARPHVGAATGKASQSAQVNLSGDSSGDKSKKATAGIDLKSVTSFLRNGASTFGMPATLLIGNTSATSVAVGDFDGDGKADLAVSNAGSSITWLLKGDGAGGFGAPARLAERPEQAVVAVGDFNEDGIEDQVLKNSLSADSTVIFGGSAEGVEKAGNISSGSLMIGDFNGDRIADIAVADSASNKVMILTGTRQGGLRAAISISVGSGPAYITTGDFNHDGIPDLAVANRFSDNVSIITGGKKGAFGAAINFRAGSGPTSIAVDDFNGDGIADLAVANDLS